MKSARENDTFLLTRWLTRSRFQLARPSCCTFRCCMKRSILMLFDVSFLSYPVLENVTLMRTLPGRCVHTQCSHGNPGLGRCY